MRYVLMAQFFIKVFLVHRHSECSFALRTHRHEGPSWRDAIVLAPGQRSTRRSPPIRSMALRGTHWDDIESKWLLVETPRLSLPQPIDLAVTVREQAEELLVSLGLSDRPRP